MYQLHSPEASSTVNAVIQALQDGAITSIRIGSIGLIGTRNLYHGAGVGIVVNILEENQIPVRHIVLIDRTFFVL